MSDKATKTSKGTLAALALTMSIFAPALSYESYEVDTTEIGKDSQGTVNSGQILELGVPTSYGLLMEGESYLKSGHLDQAIKVLQRSVEMCPGDVDSRIAYAQALEKKLIRQNRLDRDPALYNFVIKQWLCVAKSGEFGEQMQQGFTHLIKLTGSMPKRREKEKKYLERVLIPEDGSVKVVIGGPPFPVPATSAEKSVDKPKNNLDSKPIAERKKSAEPDS